MSEQLRARHFAVLLADRRHLDIDTFINYAEQKLEDYAKVVSVVVESRQSAAVKALVDAATSERNKICCQLEDGKYRDNILCHKCDMNETCAALMEFRKDQP